MTEVNRETPIDDWDGPRIARYVSGQCTAEQARAVRAWIATDARREEAVAELSRIWRAAAPTPRDWDIDRAWANLVATRAARRRSTPRESTERHTVRFRTGGRSPVVAWAARFAATTIVIIGALTVWRGAWPASQTSSGTSVTAQEYATAPGRRDTVRLLDGTRIVLGPASRLRVTAGFAIGVREVTLTGEALFTVAHDAARPFRVRASHAIVEDVGTTFNVRAYESDATTTVVVAQGRVIVRADTAVVAVRRTSDVTLEAGMLGIVADGAVRVEHDVDLTRHIAWAEGRLVFRNTPLREALPQIARWYDVDVRLADTALAGRRITGTFEAESADYVLQLVTQSLGLVYERRGRLVIVGPANGGR